MSRRLNFNAYLTGQMGGPVPRIFFIVAISIGLWQCDSPIELDYSDFEPKLVVHAQVSPQGQFIVSVTTSTTPVAAQPGEVPDAVKVTLFDNTLGINISLYRENDLFYASNLIHIRPGNEYILRAEAPGFEAVESKTRVPDKLILQNFAVTDFESKPSTVTVNKRNVNYNLELDFGTREDVYLHLIFRQHSTIKTGSVGAPEYQDLLYQIFPEFPEESGYISHVEDGVLLSLSAVDSNPLKFRFVDYVIDALFEELGNVQVEVRTVSPEYYLYFVSLSRQLQTSQDPFAEPIQVFSNVEGGLGNFSSYNVDIYEIGLN